MGWDGNDRVGLETGMTCVSPIVELEFERNMVFGFGIFH